jgi:hypothetical protein
VARRKARSTLKAESALGADTIHIHSLGTKHGPGRRWGAREWAQAAIGVLQHRGDLPPGIKQSLLVRRVWEHLNSDPHYRALGRSKPISRNTILEAAKIQGVRYVRRDGQFDN